MNSIAKSSIFYFSVLLALTYVLIALTNYYILTPDFYQRSGSALSGIPGGEIIVYENMKKWIYFSEAIYLLIKLFALSLIFYTALFLSGKTVTLAAIFKIIVLSEYIFLVPALIKIIWFYFYYHDPTLADWHKTYVLSALSMFDAVPGDWYYALQTLNVFEVVYWFILGFGISTVTGMSYDASLKIVVSSYLPALFIWVCLVTFVSLMFFPGTA
ncbi:hypothetical protein [Mucilaginibacter celer]|uniref:Yip1 domain-containing protein n=1 Tax=Mucilaginibacter celer TaxID=2305508 RepID=A0A494VJQ7_9SPHI|nr:hypothetical protein [Mucilaginibacter celer]AYL95307.1 hypothetical protein HYN43_008355 [Mucilaginibacter celer]